MKRLITKIVSKIPMKTPSLKWYNFFQLSNNDICCSQSSPSSAMLAMFYSYLSSTSAQCYTNKSILNEIGAVCSNEVYATVEKKNWPVETVATDILIFRNSKTFVTFVVCKKFMRIDAQLNDPFLSFCVQFILCPLNTLLTNTRVLYDKTQKCCKNVYSIAVNLTLKWV